jgi:hypothetical protein
MRISRAAATLLVCMACGQDEPVTINPFEPTSTCDAVPAGTYSFAGSFVAGEPQESCSWTSEVGAPSPSLSVTVTVAVPDGTSCGDLSAFTTFSLPLLDSGDCPANEDGQVYCIRNRFGFTVRGTDSEITGQADLYYEYNEGQSGGSCSPEFEFGGPVP